MCFCRSLFELTKPLTSYTLSQDRHSSDLLCMSVSATGWRGPKATDSQEPAHVLPAGASCKAAEGRLAASFRKNRTSKRQLSQISTKDWTKRINCLGLIDRFES